MSLSAFFGVWTGSIFFCKMRPFDAIPKATSQEEKNKEKGKIK